jgi:phosphatidylglycerol:prolipoprotein diacylglycerol transferase
MVIGAALGRVGCFLNGCCFGGLCESDLPKVQFPLNSPPYHYQLSQGWLHGLQLGEDDGHIGVVEVLPDSPAEEAGIKKGDEITAVNGKPVLSLADARERIASSPIAAIQLADRSTHTINFSPPARSLAIHPAQLYDAINLALMTLVLWLYYPFRRHDGELLAVGMMLYSITRFVIEIIRVDEPGQLGTGFSISQLLSFGIFLAGAVLLTYVELRNRPLSLPWHGAPVRASAA